MSGDNGIGERGRVYRGCLATMALVRGDEYIAVTAKADGDHSTEPYHVYDAFALYDLL